MDILLTYRDGEVFNNLHMYIQEATGDIFVAINGVEKPVVGKIYVNGISGEDALLSEAQSPVSDRQPEEREGSEDSGDDKAAND